MSKMLKASVDTTDIPEASPDDIAKAEVRWPKHMAETVIVDRTVLEWFKHHTADYQDVINQLLREYMQSHQKSSGT